MNGVDLRARPPVSHVVSTRRCPLPRMRENNWAVVVYEGVTGADEVETHFVISREHAAGAMVNASNLGQPMSGGFLLCDPPVRSLREYVAAGGGTGLARVRELGPGQIIDEINLSALRCLQRR